MPNARGIVLKHAGNAGGTVRRRRRV